MATADPYEKYRTIQVQTANPGELLLMLYNGALKFCVKAINEIENGNIEAANNDIIRVQDIIDELSVSLDRERGGTIASNLAELYKYINHRLIKANISKDPDILQEVITLLSGLRDAWYQVVKGMPQRR